MGSSYYWIAGVHTQINNIFHVIKELNNVFFVCLISLENFMLYLNGR